MYTTEQFDKGCSRFERLIKMCEDLEKEHNEKSRCLNKADQRRKCFLLEGKLMNKFYIVENIRF